MKRLLALCLLVLFVGDAIARGGGRGGGGGSHSSGSNSVSVRGYTRKDGTYVSPHVRNAPSSYGQGDYSSSYDNDSSSNYSLNPPTNTYKCGNVFQERPCETPVQPIQPVKNEVVAKSSSAVIATNSMNSEPLKTKVKRKYNMNPNADLRYCLELSNPVEFDKCVNQ